MDVNERVPLMNKIVTYSWAIIGIVIQVGFLMCKSYYLKKKQQQLFLHQFSSHRPVRMTKSPSVTSLCSLWIKLYVWLHQLSVCRAV